MACVIGDNGGEVTSLTKTGSASSVWTVSGTNTYTGRTAIFYSTLIVSLLADGNSPSNIGASTNVATILY